MFFKVKNISFFLEAKFFEKLIFLLPISLILGNLAINLNIFLIIISFIFEEKDQLNIKFIKNKNQLIILVLIATFFLINIINSSDIFLSTKGVLGVLKYALFFLILTIFFKKKDNFKYLSLIFFTSLNFILIDTIIQFVFGTDIFGYTRELKIGSDLTSSRLSGPFGDELVVGGFLKNIFLISMLWFLFSNKNNNIFFFYLIITMVVILLSGERASSIMFLFFCFLFIFFFNFSIKKKIIFFLTLVFTFLIFFSVNENLRKSAFDRTFKQLGIIKPDISYKGHKNFFDSQWGAHYLTAYEIYKDNKLIGSGIKSFRVECANTKYDKINSVRSNSRCATHPHNIYLEILSETGLVGSFLFIFIIAFIIKTQLKNLSSTKTDLYSFHFGILIVFLTLIWPVQTTGSFFSTFNGFFYWFYAALIFSKQNYS